LGHYRMHSMLSVMTEADFEKWQKEQEAANQ
jgi:heme/copper-type cytochrome/quinol oxidase subunit 2